jgi:hypothetical protein
MTERLWVQNPLRQPFFRHHSFGSVLSNSYCRTIGCCYHQDNIISLAFNSEASTFSQKYFFDLA